MISNRRFPLAPRAGEQGAGLPPPRGLPGAGNTLLQPVTSFSPGSAASKAFLGGRVSGQLPSPSYRQGAEVVGVKGGMEMGGASGAFSFSSLPIGQAQGSPLTPEHWAPLPQRPASLLPGWSPCHG